MSLSGTVKTIETLIIETARGQIIRRSCNVYKFSSTKSPCILCQVDISPQSVRSCVQNTRRNSGTTTRLKKDGTPAEGRRVRWVFYVWGVGKLLMYYWLSLRSQRCRSNKLDNPIFSSSLARLSFPETGEKSPRRNRDPADCRRRDNAFVHASQDSQGKIQIVIRRYWIAKLAAR